MEFKVGKRYNLSTISPIILGENYNNVKVVAERVNFDFAIKYLDVYSITKNIESTHNIQLLDPKITGYIIFKNDDDEEIVLAEDWILESSVVEINQIDAILTIKDINTEDLNIIVNAIKALNYKNIEVDTVLV